MRSYGKAQVEWKGRNDPVTQADRAANDLIVRELGRVFSDDGILSEETVDDGARLAHERVWIVDPIDGTREFIAENGEFAVMIGLAIRGQAALGVVYQPVGDALWVGIVGRGGEAVRGGVSTPLAVSNEVDPTRLRAAVSRSHRDKTTEKILDAIGVQERFPIGSVGLKVGLLAERQADLYVAAYAKSSEWDTCGPEAILRAAGGEFTDLFGRPMRYNRPDTRNRFGVCATNGRIHDWVVAAAAPIARKRGFGTQPPDNSPAAE